MSFAGERLDTKEWNEWGKYVHAQLYPGIDLIVRIVARDHSLWTDRNGEDTEQRLSRPPDTRALSAGNDACDRDASRPEYSGRLKWYIAHAYAGARASILRSSLQ